MEITKNIICNFLQDHLTLIVVLPGRDNADGLSIDSQTNAVAVYVPVSIGIQDNAELND